MDIDADRLTLTALKNYLAHYYRKLVKFKKVKRFYSTALVHAFDSIESQPIDS